ncbi:helix-turn-helix domain-containing protein [Pseudomonas aeruginosa]|uniref:helix-turn-helix domain-containing protein n=1 Tax=Pseudomonas aeruginosa TaxID=287 RepID=UPI00106AF09B|nr:helix-turn-helix domain-containing protein [Pseudomonas aeruginosa]MCO3670167.1 helix-turn-helix domain-containing protein [Pseudomonas aeruginosa]HBO9019103.1 helix-turn-helix domain-containing protein [Pseudomonas aeruginosa]HEH9487682.1 helix-turn-helix domain-containing protein [Pseudomonas aeruginosa]
MQTPLQNALRPPTETEIAAAIASLRHLQPLLSSKAEIQQIALIGEGASRQDLQMPTSAIRLLGQALCEIAVGHAVQIVPIRAELTTQEAADLLHVSRPSLVKLLDAGEIPHTKVGRHRRVRLADLATYKERRDAANHTAWEKLSSQAQQLGMGYEPD